MKGFLHLEVHKNGNILIKNYEDVSMSDWEMVRIDQKLHPPKQVFDLIVDGGKTLIRVNLQNVYTVSNAIDDMVISFNKFEVLTQEKEEAIDSGNCDCALPF